MASTIETVVEGNSGARWMSHGIPTFYDLPELKFLIVGSCLTQTAVDELQRLSKVYRIQIKVDMAWPSQLNSNYLPKSDVLVFQPSINWFLRPLWDNAPFLTDSERREHLEVLKSHLLISLRDAKQQAGLGLLLVQGFSTPVYSPLGISEFRFSHNFLRIVSTLNEVIWEFIKDDPDAMFIDEERLLSAVGKLRLMDDTVSLYSHHGCLGSTAGIAGGPSIEETFDISGENEASRLFARSYIESYLAWSGLGRIKCIIVDLDNTLWPGEAGQDGFDLHEVREQLEFGVYAGIHQALKILKHRGLLLATCSRNSDTAAQAAFACLESLSIERQLTHLLWRDDFVIQKVNWNSKVNNVREIASVLGIAPDAMLFIDDSAIEREAVRRAFPSIRTIGENLYLVRSFLLSDPCLQTSVVTAEAAVRTTAVKAKIEREANKSGEESEYEFLRSLEVRLTISNVLDPDRLIRLSELTQRTNQFNTTLARLSVGQIKEHLSACKGSAYILEAADRFASYGLVGACLMMGDEVTAFVMSCRVIPLRLEVPFLTLALGLYGRAPIRAAVVDGPRNFPCRSVYLQAGFTMTQNNCYQLNDLSALTIVDENLYRVHMESAAMAQFVVL
jgi:FkbH-like protein